MRDANERIEGVIAKICCVCEMHLSDALLQLQDNIAEYISEYISVCEFFLLG